MTNNEQKMLLALEDAGMDKEISEVFMDYYGSGQWENGKKLLLTHRISLLDHIHKEQGRLYCTDFLIMQLGKTKGKIRL